MGSFLDFYRGREDSRLPSLLPLACGSPAHGSTKVRFLIGIGINLIGLRASFKVQSLQSRHFATACVLVDSYPNLYACYGVVIMHVDAAG